MATCSTSSTSIPEEKLAIPGKTFGAIADNNLLSVSEIFEVILKSQKTCAQKLAVDLKSPSLEVISVKTYIEETNEMLVNLEDQNMDVSEILREHAKMTFIVIALYESGALEKTI